MSYKLPNYLRTYRKRAGFTQDEMALLLGCKSGAKVSRYEHFQRQPNLQTAFAYQVIFNTPPKELFTGIFQQVERKTNKHVQMLIKSLSREEPNTIVARKLEVLQTITSKSTVGTDKSS